MFEYGSYSERIGLRVKSIVSFLLFCFVFFLFFVFFGRRGGYADGGWIVGSLDITPGIGAVVMLKSRE